MKIKIKMTRAENTAQYGTESVSLEIEEYLCGVVPAEVYESSGMDALKAQAVTARTFALKRALAGTVIDDTTAFQAYRYNAANNNPRSREAVNKTTGQVLCYGSEIIDCFYSNSNGGQTKRSGDVWSKHYPYYINKPDAWDTAANMEAPAKPSHGIGMSQIGAMWAAKEGVPYNEILAFYYDGAAIVSDYGNGSVVCFEAEMPEEKTGGFVLKLTTNFMTRNDCYTAGRKITPKGIMVHSTATPGVMAAQWFSRWNKSFKAGEIDRQACVHAFLDDKEVCQYLPWDHRGWHCGSGSKGSGNDSHISFEICEPAGFSYSGGSTMAGYDIAKNEAYFRAAWNNAVELCAMLCRQYGLNETNIICHSEGYTKGIASNHGDVMHWWPKHGENMDTFRAAVKKALSGGGSSGTVPPNAEAPPALAGSIAPGMLVEIKPGTANYYPGGPGVPVWVISDFNHYITAVTSGGKPVVKGGKTCVLLGKKTLKNGGAEEDGVNTWVDTDVLTAVGTAQVQPSAFLPYTVKVTADSLNIRSGAGANYDITGSIKDKGVYTIVDESDDQGASKWGKLKSGMGWIALEYTQKQ